MYAVYRFRHDSCKKKEGEEKEEEEIVERNGEMESGPSFRTLVSIGGRVQVSSWAAGS